MRHNTFAELPVGYTADPGGSAQRTAILLKAHESMCDGRTSNVHQTGHDLSPVRLQVFNGNCCEETKEDSCPHPRHNAHPR